MMNEQDYLIEDIEKLFANIPCGVGIFDTQHNPLFLNDAYYDLVGYSPEEYKSIIDNRDESLIFQSDEPNLAQIRLDLGKGEELCGAEYRIVQKGGSVKWVRLSVSYIKANGKYCALCFFEDITPQKENFAQLKMITDNIGSSISLIRIHDGQEELVYGNSKFFEFIGVDAETYKREMKSFDSLFVSQEDHAVIKSAIVESYKTGEPKEVEYRFVRSGKKTLWMNRRMVMVPQDEMNTYLLISVATDITEKKHAQMIYKLEHSRYQLVIQEMHAAVFEWNFVTNEFYSSPSY